MRCGDIMKSEVQCLTPETTAREAARRMREENVGFLPVCDESMRAIGAVTDRDIALRVVAEDKPADTPVGQLMTREVIACHPDDDLSEARELMSQHQKSRIMCVDDDGRLEGVISLSDIAQLDEVAGASVLKQVSGREARGYVPGID